MQRPEWSAAMPVSRLDAPDAALTLPPSALPLCCQHKDPLPRLQLLGLSINDAINAGVYKKTKLPLSKRDKARIENMLKSEIGQRDAVIR